MTGIMRGVERSTASDIGRMRLPVYGFRFISTPEKRGRGAMIKRRGCAGSGDDHWNGISHGDDVALSRKLLLRPCDRKASAPVTSRNTSLLKQKSALVRTFSKSHFRFDRNETYCRRRSGFSASAPSVLKCVSVKERMQTRCAAVSPD